MTHTGPYDAISDT